jgi:hypothetical protein
MPGLSLHSAFGSHLSIILQIFVIRKLSSDMEMDIYNRMVVEVQQNPKFAHYFAPFTGMAH